MTAQVAAFGSEPVREVLTKPGSRSRTTGSTAPGRTGGCCGSGGGSSGWRRAGSPTRRRRPNPSTCGTSRAELLGGAAGGSDGAAAGSPRRRRRRLVLRGRGRRTPVRRGTSRRSGPTRGGCAFPPLRCPGGGRSRTRRCRSAAMPPIAPPLATLVLIDLLVNASDDWFTVTLLARSGTVVTYDAVMVIDSFGDRWRWPRRTTGACSAPPDSTRGLSCCGPRRGRRSPAPCRRGKPRCPPASR